MRAPIGHRPKTQTRRRHNTPFLPEQPHCLQIEQMHDASSKAQGTTAHACPSSLRCHAAGQQRPYCTLCSLTATSAVVGSSCHAGRAAPRAAARETALVSAPATPRPRAASSFEPGLLCRPRRPSCSRGGDRSCTRPRPAAAASLRSPPGLGLSCRRRCGCRSSPTDRSCAPPPRWAAWSSLAESPESDDGGEAASRSRRSHLARFLALRAALDAARSS